MLYKDYISRALKEVLNIYGPDTVGHLNEFKYFFEDYTLLSVINGENVLFASAGDVPTKNIRQALIGSGLIKMEYYLWDDVFLQIC